MVSAKNKHVTHIALDLLPLLAGKHGTLFLDEWAYPISQEGAALAAHRGAHLVSFPHNEGQALAAALQSTASNGERVIVCDGVYSAGGYPAALRSFLRVAGEFGVLIYVDDAHGVGILGEHPGPGCPYGRGGGGICAYLSLPAGRIVHVGSLSKAFGVPLAFVAGPAAFIDYLEANAGTFIHSSPPDLPSLAAALAALQVHARYGEQLRTRLAQSTARLRAGLHQQGINLVPNRQSFPRGCGCAGAGDWLAGGSNYQAKCLNSYPGQNYRSPGNASINTLLRFHSSTDP